MDLSRFLEEDAPFTQEEKEQIEYIQSLGDRELRALMNGNVMGMLSEQAEFYRSVQDIGRFLDARYISTGFCEYMGVPEEKIDNAYYEASALASQLLLPSKVLAEEASRQEAKGDAGIASRASFVYRKICQIKGIKPLDIEYRPDELLQALKEDVYEAQATLPEDSPLLPYLSSESTFTPEERGYLAQFVKADSLSEKTHSEAAEGVAEDAKAILSGWLDHRDATLKFAELMGVDPETIDRAYAESASLAKDLAVPSDILGAEAKRLEAKGDAEQAKELIEVYESLCEEYKKEPEYPKTLDSVAQKAKDAREQAKAVSDLDAAISAMDVSQAELDTEVEFV